MDTVARLRAICLALPEAAERVSHGEPTWFVHGKRTFVMLDDHHHREAHLGFWCPAPPGVQAEMVEAEPARFFRPPYVGRHGWLGVRLVADGLDAPDWAEIEQIVHDAYRHVAPKALAARVSCPR